MTAPKRVRLSRVKGYRKPEGAVVVARPGPYGNPFPFRGDWITWTAIAIGYRGDETGRRAAAVALHRAWMTRVPIEMGEYAGAPSSGGSIVYSDGTSASVDEVARGFALAAASLGGGTPTLPERPDLTPLRGCDLACWCPLDQPCHADILLELANEVAR